MRRALAVVALVAGLAGCAVTPLVRETAAPPPPSRDETVVLLPGAGGKVGALTIVHEGHQQTLDAPYATARVQRQGQLANGLLTNADIGWSGAAGPDIDRKGLPAQTA